MNRQKVSGITIDGKNSRDLDDGIFLEKQSHQWLLHVSITDVAHYIAKNSEIDLLARKKVFTRYFATANSPMLPRHLADDRLSLLPGEYKPTITITIPINHDLETGEPTIQHTLFENKCQLSYEAADAIIENESHKFHELLKNCRELALLLLEKRRQRGALAIYDLQKGWYTNEEGKLFQLSPEKANVSNIIIQEFAIIANAEMAFYLTSRDLPLLYRNHTAKKATPPSNDLLEDIIDTLLNPQHFDLGNLNQRMALLLNKAEYETCLRGHYGLNVPAYTHWTSPIRRYPDLVVQMLLKAFLNNAEIPFTMQELDEIAQHCNRVYREVREKKDEYFREKREKDRQIAIEQGNISALEMHAFHQLIKTACQQELLEDELRAEIIKRLTRQELPEKSILIILFASPTVSEDWRALKILILVLILQNSGQAKDLIFKAVQKFKWEFPHLTFAKSGPSHNPVFECVGNMKIADKEYTTRPQLASSKSHAEQNAIVDLMSRIAGCQFGFDDEEKITAKTSLNNPIKNYKSLLQELCQRYGTDFPVYETQPIAKDGANFFNCVVKFQLAEHDYTSKECIAVRKKTAEQLAAKSAWEMIPDIIKCEKTTVIPDVEDGNFVGALQIIAQKKQYCAPQYEIVGRPKNRFQKDFVVECSVIFAGHEFRAAGNGYNKQRAKQQAAEKVYLEVRDRLQHL